MYKFISSNHIATVCLMLLLAGVTLAGCGLSSSIPPAGYSDFPSITDSEEDMADEVFDLTNDERTAEGLSTLVWNDQLAAAAWAHAIDMDDRNYFDHYSPEGDSVAERAKAAGYTYTYLGENLAWGQFSATQVVYEWMHSPGHRLNIVHASYTELGVAVREDSDGRYHWVQVFGKQMPAGY